MSLRSKQFNGFKFSFKRQENSACSTPKFTSIELDSKEFSKLKRKQVLRPPRSARKIHKKEQEEPLHYSVSNQNLNSTKITSSHKIISVRAQIEENSHEIHGLKRQKSGLSFDRKLFPPDRQKRKEIIKNQSFQKLLKPPLKGKQENQKEETNLTYLEIFKREKHKQGKNILHNLNLTLKKDLDTLNESPKSVNSHRPFRETPKIFNKFFPRETQTEELAEMTPMPETTKSKRFNEEAPNQFFRKADTKKNLGLSKALFKTQKTNVNVRLNNIGGGISKLNIRID